MFSVLTIISSCIFLDAVNGHDTYVAEYTSKRPAENIPSLMEEYGISYHLDMPL